MLMGRKEINPHSGKAYLFLDNVEKNHHHPQDQSSPPTPSLPSQLLRSLPSAVFFQKRKPLTFSGCLKVLELVKKSCKVIFINPQRSESIKKGRHIRRAYVMRAIVSESSNINALSDK